MHSQQIFYDNRFAALLKNWRIYFALQDILFVTAKNPLSSCISHFRAFLAMKFPKFDVQTPCTNLCLSSRSQVIERGRKKV